jgi:hypothetical protein
VSIFDKLPLSNFIDEQPVAPDYMPQRYNPRPLCNAYTQDAIEALFQKANGQQLSDEEIWGNFAGEGHGCNLVWKAMGYKGTRSVPSSIKALKEKGIEPTAQQKDFLKTRGY